MSKQAIVGPDSIRVIEAAAGTGRIQGRTANIIRGKLTSNFFRGLTVPNYQRLAMEDLKAEEIHAALGEDGLGVPDDLMLCARHEAFNALGDNEFLVQRESGIFVLDGHQRLAAALDRLNQGLWCDDMGAKIFFGTSLHEEIRTFYQVNRKQTKVSTQVLLRNFGDNAAIAALRKLATDDPKFPQVQWDQRRQPGEVITAHMLYELAVVLHGRTRNGEIEDLIVALDQITDKFGTELLVRNMKRFFEVVHKCFGEGTKRDGEIYANDKKRFMYRLTLLQAMAMVFAQHENFWAVQTPASLFLRAEDMRKISAFPARTIERNISLTSAVKELHDALIKHMNGHRKEDEAARLRPRDPSFWFPAKETV